MTACSSNLRQIALALRMYQEDWNGDLPLEPFVDTWMFQQWPNDPLKPYTKSGAIYHCPDADTSHGTLASDYWMRSALLPEAKDKKRIRPEPRTVLVYCDNHIRRRDFTPDAGEYLVLRADASVSRVPAAAVVKWLYLNGRWIAPGEGSDRILGASIWPVFPQEPWPPEFVQ